MQYIVSPDGAGGFTSLQAAVDAVPSAPAEPVTILLRSGVYPERAVIHRDNLRVIGESREGTVLTASACARDYEGPYATYLTATLMVTGRNVTLENLTVRNDAGDGRRAGQAIALYAAGDGGIFRNLDLIANQDTLFCGPLNPTVSDFISPRQGAAECVQVENLGSCTETRSSLYFENCRIRGDVDFIFGPYRCWFEGCTLYMNERGGFYTAANTPEEQSLGFVFHACTLTGDCPAGEGWLGRPWRKFARTVFLNCEMDEQVAPAGFTDWDSERVVTARMGEYGTTGARADLSCRNPAEKRLTEAEAAALADAFRSVFPRKV